MAAYEIIELFCELLVVRLPIIDSQRLEFSLSLSLIHTHLFIYFTKCAEDFVISPMPLSTPQEQLFMPFV